MPRIDAIDLAQVAPAWVSSQPAPCRQALHFHSGVSAEALPFDDNSFDLVTSQYGIEYCDDVRTTPEVARVLAPDGRVALLLHHADSRLARSEEHTSELQSLTRISYAVFCLKTKKTTNNTY